MNHDVFISYSSQNREAAQAICHVLEQSTIRCWIAPRDIPGGSQYGDVIDDAIKTAKVVVVLFSQTAAASPWVNGELNVAFDEQKIIIPFRLDNTPLKGQSRVMLSQKHWIDAYPDYKTKFADLVSAVSSALGRPIVTEYGSNKSAPDNTRFKRWGVGAALMVIITVLFIFLRPVIASKYSGAYKYSNESGITVYCKDLSSDQRAALTSILDDMVLVEGGTFVMGNDYRNADYFTEQDSLSINPHEVTLSNFYICKSELTQAQWKAFFDLTGHYTEFGTEKAVDIMSWQDAKNFADTLAALTGLMFSLPTEAQWEYAARGSKDNVRNNYIFSGSNDATKVAWTSYDGLTSAHIVKSGKEKNALGLYDMTGNVSEWCLDYFALYEAVASFDPAGPSSGMHKVIRGGDYRLENLFDMKTTTRYYDAPFVQRKATGIRLVINIK